MAVGPGPASRQLHAPRGRVGRRRVATAGGIGALLVAALLAPAGPALAQGLPPGPPALVAPADGATQVPTGQQLRVTATDPDDATLDVSFYGRPSSGGGTPNTAGDFTFAVIPDTQNYVSAAANKAIMGRQTQWLVDSRQRLNTAFVTHLGDIVGIDTNVGQWQSASGYLATLDAAGVPNTVLPGNHDINLTTGESPLYQQYFPVSRYAGATWNSPSASYGGYLGQNQFGPDPVNRQNMDNYALFTAGGMDFLLLNLEFNTPDYVIDWAKRVLAAYPTRRAIVATHSYVNYNGQISTQMDRADGGNSPVQLWQKLIQPSCSIFMVVSGHFHNGDVSEARRTDTNACGGTVQGLLSDYQARIRGGDGWLRYYTFKPALDQIQAVTYSPTLDAFETDADSAFTMPYEMRTPDPFPKIGQVTVAAGGTASIPMPSLPAGTGYQWYATVSDGTSTTTGPTWSFTTASATPTALARDGFDRTVTSTWGAADLGGSWTTTGGATRFSVAGGDGVTVTPGGVTTTAALAPLGSTATDTSVQFRLDAIPNAVTHLSVAGRRVGSSMYGAKLKVNAAGTTDLRLFRDGTDLTSGVPLGFALTAGQRLAVRIQVEGTSPTTIRARAWRVGSTEPSGWAVTTTDAAANLQVPGGISVSTYLSSAATTGPATVRWDDLLVTPLGSPPPPVNVAPSAAFTSSSAGLQAAVNGSASADSDGTIASYAWTFGDGGTATGATATHTYAAAGTYPVTLTVTDDDGATDVETAQVTVTAPPPASTVIAADTFSRTVASGWGAADTGGSWTVAGGSGSSVSGGQGVQAAAPGTTKTATLSGVSSSATDLVTQLGLDALANATVQVTISGRTAGSAHYAVQPKISASGGVTLTLTASGTNLVSGALTGTTLAAGEKLLVRLQVQGTSPTTLRARAWKAGTAEPTTWRLTATDSTAALQVPGGLRLSTYLSSSATTGPVTVRFDDLRALRLD